MIRGGAIGDFILTLPSLHAFRDRFPGARVQIMGYPHIAALAHQRFYAEALRSIDHRSVASFFASRGELDPELSRYFASFDAVVSYLYDPDQVFQSNLKRAGARRVIPASGKPEGRAHASDFMAQWLAAAGVVAPIHPPRLYLAEAERAAAKGVSDVPTVAVHLGSGSASKNWPMERLVEICAWLTSRGFRVAVISGPADTARSERFWKHPETSACLSWHHQPLPLLAAMIERCAAFLGHDSGISHLAAAVGTPTVAIFGPTSPSMWGPRGKRVSILHRGMRTEEVTSGEVKSALAEILVRD